ncbi:MAG: hypothetical protein KBC21_00020 [Candidatus Pacebacteria bacterium]|nr:hypothetical protein [Candidatus Paceibacterota bacterium]
MKNFFKKLSTRLAVGVVAVAAVLSVSMYAFATAVVTPAAGGTNISIDTTTASGGSATYVTLTGGPVITESAVGDIALGIHTLTLPTGWQFDTTQNVTIGVGGTTELSVSAPVVTPGLTTLSFNVNATSQTGVGVLTFTGMKVVPTGTTTSSGEITMTAGTVTGVTNGVTSFGTLSTVPGSVTKLAFTVQPSATTTYGSAFAQAPVIRTQDQFGNNSVNSLPSTLSVTLSLTTGTGALTGTVSANIGTSGGNGVLTFTGVGVNDIGNGKQITATGAPLTSAVSSLFDIQPKPITATVVTDNKVYDGNTTATISSASVASLIELGDTVTVSSSSYVASFATSTAGNGINVNVTGLSLAGSEASKYNLAATSTGSANITRATVNVTASTTLSKVYGDTDPSLTYSDSGLLPGNSFTGSLTRATGENVGTRAITQGTLSALPNYDISFTGANLTITARPIAVTASTGSKVYDRTTASTSTPSITTGSLAFSDTANFTQSYDTFLVGTGKTLTPAGTVNDSNSGNNYLVTFNATTTGIITTKALTVTGLSASDKPYDGNTTASVTGTAALVGVVAPDSVNVSGSPVGTFSTSTVGSNTVTVTGLSLGGGDETNYSLTQPTLNASITAKPITVTPNVGQSKVYGAVDPTITYTNTALIGGDVFTGALSRAVGGNVGTYAITQGTLALSANYAITLAPETFEITAKPITVTASSTQSKVYSNNSATDPVFDYSVSPALVGVDTFTGTLSRVAGENVGAYAIATGTLSAGTNYAMTFNSNNFTIVKATPVITWAAPADIIYGTLLSPTQLNASPSVAGAFVYTPASSTLLNAGNGQVLSTAFTPTDSGNYNGVTATTSINVAKATPIITWATPSAIAAGTALSGTQLNASPSTPGAFVYTPASGYTGFTTVGTVTLSTDFTPTDTANYNSVASTTVSLTIVPAAIAQFSLATTTSDVTVPSVVTVTGKDTYGNIVTNDSSTVVSFTPVNASSVSDFFKTLVSGVTTTSVSKLTAGYAQINAYVNGNGAVTPKATTLTFTDASDRTAPVISSIATDKSSYEATNDTNITVTVTEDNTANSVTVNGNTATETTPTSGIWMVTFVKATTVGTQSLAVAATDISGNVATMSGSYNVIANLATVITPTVTLSGDAIQSAYSLTQATSRFASGVQFNTTNAATTTVNGVVVTSGATTTVETFASSTTLGVHTYNVVVTSATGATASITVSYQVNADNVVPVMPTITLSGQAIMPLYTVSQATARFPSGLQFTTTDAATTTVNGSVITSGATTTVETQASSTSVGVHTYNVVVTSLTGHTASITVSYQVNADAPVQGNGTLGVSGITTINSTMTADNSYTNGGSWTFFVTVPTTETNLALKFGDWVSGSNSIATASNMRIYSAQSSNATATTSALTITAANTYSTNLLLTGDLDSLVEGRQVAVTVDLKVPTTTLGGSYSTNYGVRSN